MVVEILSNIKRIRKEKNITQEKLAKGLNLDYSSYGKIERGAVSLYTDQVNIILKILKVDPSEIYPEFENFEFKKLLPNIRRIRKDQKLSAREMAEHLGLDTSTFLKIERGEIRLTINRLEKIADIFGVKVCQLF